MLITFVSLFPLLFIRLEGFQASIFWLYSTLMTLFLIFTYFHIDKYRPVPDLGYRPSVTVIIPAKNEKDAIVQTIEAILNSDYPHDKLNVVVVDDGSTDNTVKEIKKIKNSRLTLIRHEINRGKRIAFATGLKYTVSEIVICIDSDSFVDKNAIKFLVQPFLRKNIGAVCGHGYASNIDKNLLTKLQHYWYQEMFLIMKSMEAQFGCVTCCSGILAAYRREIILPVLDEWLNEKFFGRPILIGDDRQMTNLVLRGGSKYATRESEVTYQSNAIVYTIVPKNFKQFWKQQLRWKRAWVHGTKLASTFMWKKKFPIPYYFFIYQFLTYMNPIIIIYSHRLRIPLT